MRGGGGGQRQQGDDQHYSNHGNEQDNGERRQAKEQKIKKSHSQTAQSCELLVEAQREKAVVKQKACRDNHDVERGNYRQVAAGNHEDVAEQVAHRVEVAGGLRQE